MFTLSKWLMGLWQVTGTVDQRLHSEDDTLAFAVGLM